MAVRYSTISVAEVQLSMVLLLVPFRLTSWNRPPWPTLELMWESFIFSRGCNFGLESEITPQWRFLSLGRASYDYHLIGQFRDQVYWRVNPRMCAV